MIDICGTPDASCRYAPMVWGLEKKPIIGVRPVNHPGVKVTKAIWRGTNAVESWAWKGCSGNEAEVEAYAQAAYVELLLNEERMGRKKLKNYKAMFKLKYTPGVLTAIAYDAKGKELSRSQLCSTEGMLHIAVEPESKTARPGQIVYVPVSLKDDRGTVEYNADRKLSLFVESGTLPGFGNANPCTEEQYHTGSFTSYLGRALAIVRVETDTTVTVTDGAYMSKAIISVQ